MKPQTKILVTGAKGQLGKKIIEMLSPNYALVLTDSQEMDITDQISVNKVIGEEQPDFIIHAAAYTRVDAAEENEEICRKVNALGTKNIAEAAKANDATVIYISTDYVFDGTKTTPYVETDIAKPLSVYGQTKYEGEEFVRNICEKYFIIRTAWVFGELPEGHPGTNFVETMLRLAQEKDELNIVGDQIGSPTYTGDLVDIIEQIIKYAAAKTQGADVPYGTYHFSGQNPASWYDFAIEIFNQTNTTIKVNSITSDQYPQKAKRPTYSYLSKDKIEKAFKTNVRDWKEMLAEYLIKR